MNENQYLEREHAIHGNRNPMPPFSAPQGSQDSAVDLGEYESKSNSPYIADLMKIKHDMIDPEIATKVREIDNYVKEQILSTGMKSNLLSYQAILKNIVSFENIRPGEGLKLIDSMFKEIALQNKSSGKSYLTKAKEKQFKEKIRKSLATLKQALA